MRDEQKEESARNSRRREIRVNLKKGGNDVLTRVVYLPHDSNCTSELKCSYSHALSYNFLLPLSLSNDDAAY
jgi:hypothetical protein